jgi:hypothetical protein
MAFCSSHSSEGKIAIKASGEELLEDKYEQDDVQGIGGKELFWNFVLTAPMVSGFCFRLEVDSQHKDNKM